MLLIYIELFFCFILFQTISLVHRKKVSLYFAYPFFSTQQKRSLVKNDNYEKKSSPPIGTVVIQQIKIGI